MACGTREQIENGIINKANLMLNEKGVFPNVPFDTKQLEELNSAISAVNKEFGEELIKPEVVGKIDGIHSPEDLFNSIENIKATLAIIEDASSKIQSNATIGLVWLNERNPETLKKVLVNNGLSENVADAIIGFGVDNKLFDNVRVEEILVAMKEQLIMNSKGMEVYYNRMSQEADRRLESKLTVFLQDKLGVEVFENLKEQFGSAIAVSDLLNKSVTVLQATNLKTIPEEVGHFFFEMLGNSNKLYKELIRNVETWAGYKKVFEEYKGTYLTKDLKPDVNKIKREAVAQAIGEAVVRNYKAEEGDTFFKLIQQAIDYLKELVSKIGNFNFEAVVDDIAKDILKEDLTKLKQLDTTDYNLRKYAESVKNEPEVVDIIERLKKVGAVLTGSLSYRDQGTMYRPIDEDIHDIDVKVYWPSYKGNIAGFVEKIQEEFPGAEIRKKEDGTLFMWKSLDSDHTTVMMNINGFPIDLFFETENYKPQETVDGNANWYDSFVAKLKMGRPKDMFDWLKWSNFTRTNLNDITQPNTFYQLKVQPSEQLIDTYEAAIPAKSPEEQDKETTSDPNIESKYFRYGPVTDVKNVLKTIARSFHPLNQVAEKLLESADAFNFEVRLVPGATVSGKNAATFNLSSDGNSYIEVARGATFKARNGEVEPSLIHEIVHAFTVQYISDHRNMPHVTNLNDLNEALKYLIENESQLKDKYPITNEAELIAEFFSNGTFINDLKKLPSTSKLAKYDNAWQQLLDYIMNIFNFDQVEKTLYEQLFGLMADVVESSVDYRLNIEEHVAAYAAEHTLMSDAFKFYEEQEVPPVEAIEQLHLLKSQTTTMQPAVVYGIDTPGKPTLIPFAKIALPESFNRHMEGKFNSHEQAQNTTTKLFQRLRKVLPSVTVKFIEPEDLKQEDHSIPVQNVSAFVQGEIIYLVKNRVTNDTTIEELLHPFVLGLYHNNSSLFSALLAEALPLMQQEFDFYSKNRGELDAQLEVVTKALTSKILSTPSQNSFMNFVRLVLSKVFPKSIKNIASKDIPTDYKIKDLANMFLSGGFKFESMFTDRVYYSATDNAEKQEQIFNEIINDPAIKQVSKRSSDEGYYDGQGKRIKRVTSVADDQTKKKFIGRPRKDLDALLDNIKKENGTAAHGAIDDIMDRYVDKATGFLRAGPNRPSTYKALDEVLYLKLELSISERLKSYPQGTRFIWEQVVYNPNVRVKLNEDEIKDGNYATKGLAGTIDFIAITPDAKIHILDWKFIGNTENMPMNEHHKSWKRDSYEVQLHSYVDAISQIAGLKPEDFRTVRIVPYLATYNEAQTGLINIVTPTLDIKKIDHKKLLPYVSQKEAIENSNLKEILQKLRNIPALFKENRDQLGLLDLKAENEIEDAVSDFMLTGNFEPLYNFYVNVYEGVILPSLTRLKDIAKSPLDESNQNSINHNLSAIEDFLDSVNLFYKSAEHIYGPALEKSIADTQEGLKIENQLKEDIRKLHSNIGATRDQMKQLQLDLVDAQVRMNGITGIKGAERRVSGFSRNMTYHSRPETKAAAALYNQIKRLFPKINRIIRGHKDDFSLLKADLEKFAKAKGQTIQQVSDSLLSFDENGKFNGRFKAKVDQAFYEDKASAKKDLESAKNWFNRFYDMNLVRKEFNEIIATKYKEIDAVPNLSAQSKKFQKERVNMQWNIDTSLEAYERIYDKKYLLENQDFVNTYYSEWYKNLLSPENAPLLNVYRKFMSINKKLVDSGFLEPKYINTFIPNIHNAPNDVSIKGLWRSLKDKFIADDEAGLYGKYDPISGKMKKEMFVPYVGDYFQGDYTNKSRDLFKSYALFVEEAEKSIALKEMLPFASNLLKVEQGKKVLITNPSGNFIKDLFNKTERIEEVDDSNWKYLAMHIDAIFYGQELQDTIDKRFTVYDSKTGQGTTYSTGKMIKEGMGWMYLNTFGLNVFSPLRNYVGGIGSTMFLSGKHFNKRDLFTDYIKRLTTIGRKPENIDSLIGVLIPFVEPEWKKFADDLSYKKLNHWLTVDNIMGMMRVSSKAVQFRIIHAILANSITINGKIENVNTYVDALPEYKNLYNLAPEERTKMIREMDLRKQQLLLTNSLQNSLDKSTDKLKIKGIADENLEEEFNKLTLLIQYYSKKATGENTKWDHIGYRTSTIGRLIGMYKNWIPRTITARYGTMKYNADIESYEWGRWLSYWDTLSQAYKDSFGKAVFYSMGMANKERLIDYAKKHYINSKNNLIQQGRLFTDEFMSEKDFIDQYLRDYRNTMTELYVIVGLSLLMVSVLLAPGDDDDEDTRNMKNFFRYQVDRLIDEYMFYINPNSFTDIFGKAIPAISYIGNVFKFISQMIKQSFGVALDTIGFEYGEELMEKAKPSKYFFRSFPISSEIMKYIPLISPDLAKEMGIKTRVSSSY